MPAAAQPDPKTTSGEHAAIQAQVRSTLERIRQRSKTKRLQADSTLFKLKTRLMSAEENRAAIAAAEAEASSSAPSTVVLPPPAEPLEEAG